MDLTTIPAWDLHTRLSVHESGRDLPRTDNSAEWWLKMCREAGISVSFCASYEAENRELLHVAEQHTSMFGWISVNPDCPKTFPEAAEQLRHPKAVGIEVASFVPSRKSEPLFGFAEETGAALCLSADGNGARIGDLANRHPSVPVLLSTDVRNGCEALRRSAHGNLYLLFGGDEPILNLVLERLVERFGSSHLLLGSGGSVAPGYLRGRVEYARIPDEDKIRILQSNARRLFPSAEKAVNP